MPPAVFKSSIPQGQVRFEDERNPNALKRAVRQITEPKSEHYSPSVLIYDGVK